MKTAMQEFEILFYKKAQPTINTNSWVVHKDEFEKLILAAKEKEKEQIITAFEVGYKSCDLDETFEINRKLASGELHYNKTYNQNK
jgi:hypothetical protein